MSKYTNHAKIPLPLAVFLASDYYDGKESNVITATTLLKPIRQIILSSRINPEESPTDISSLISSRLGTAIHDSIEKAWTQNYVEALKGLGYKDSLINRIAVNPSKEELTEDTIPVYLEQRAYKPVGKYTLSGKFDFVAEGMVQDFKSTSVYTYINQSNADKYILQGSIYRWLNPELITQDTMTIHYIFTDWSAVSAKQSKDYPQSRLISQRYTLKSLTDTDRYIKDKISLIEKYIDTKEEDLPLCTDEDLWRKPTQYKYYKNPTSSRSTKNFDNKAEAYLRLHQEGNVGIVREVKGQVSACKYCSAFALCKQKDRLIENGDLII